MYTPSHYIEPNLGKLHEFIEGNSFATVVSIGRDTPIASHLPLLLDRDTGPNGQLIGHMAKANPQWTSASEQRLLTIFRGPHAYVSPTWYRTQNAVPTWNYVAVHVYGMCRLVGGRANKRDIVRRYVDFYEATMLSPWSLDSVDSDYLDKLLDAITCFRIDIDQIHGTWKLNQNHEPARRRTVIQGLTESGSEDQLQIAQLMLENLRQDEKS